MLAAMNNNDNEKPNSLKRTRIDITASSILALSDQVRRIKSTKRNAWSAIEWKNAIEFEILDQALMGNRTIEIAFYLDNPSKEIESELKSHFSILGFNVTWLEKKIWIDY